MATDFSTRLKDLLEDNGRTQAWLADKAGTTEATISRYLSGIHQPNLAIVTRIAQALDVSLDYIMDLSLDPRPSRQPERDIVILCNAYRRSDAEHQKLVWSILDSYLTADEREYIVALREKKAAQTA